MKKKILLVMVLALAVMTLFLSCESLSLYSNESTSYSSYSQKHNLNTIKRKPCFNGENTFLPDVETEHWIVYKKDYSGFSTKEEILFQIGYYKDLGLGFILFDDGDELTSFSREGLDLRWDWGENERDGKTYSRYSFVITPNGYGLYYDFKTSTDGTAKARDVYYVKKI